ncbi:4Fe-4S dicluster domain-containing protein [Calditerricola satsumensis]|uniref:4Fe-4S ferredoxin-type domain-containing protein n=1 Tax=Calditerricola satsumensis TaxID=373054 RepID=A0A8J3FCJ9_9BACI|nr:4Fe-4S dicluster domain-containing protein [Calditerricola satsumensis]GGK06254.1 hypothetical protein GCM10007043_20340 [Calditerricola satsumensis]
MNGMLVLNWIAFLLVTAYAVSLFVYVVRTRYAFVKLGRPVAWEGDRRARWRRVWTQVFGQKKLLKDKKSGVMHVVMFYGFIILQFGAIDLIWKGLAPGSHLPLGPLYPAFTFLQELTTLAVILAVLYAAYRRYVEKLPRLKRGWKPSIVLWFIGSLMLSVLLAAAFEQRWLGHAPGWAAPVSSLLAGAFAGLSPDAAAVAFFVAWWAHLLILLSFLVYVPQSKHFHLITGPLNVYWQRLGPPKPEPINFDDETQEEFGVGRIEQFTQKQLLDLYACVECGRCTSMCPASGTGKMLSPMDLIVKLRDHLTAKGAAVTSKQPWVPAFAFAHTPENQLARAAREVAAAGTAEARGEAPAAAYDVQLIGDVITEQEIWACTTCRNCEDQCPVMNEHVDKIIDLRRYLVLTQGEMPAEAARVFQNIERQYNPWGLSKNDRAKWRDGAEVPIPTVHEVEDFEYLLWVGSMGSYDNRSMKVVRALAKVLHEAGVSFAILGNEEKNSGDTPRRLGNEFLFQQLVQENIETFRQHNVRKIVTIDPHAYHTFKNEYPDFGFAAEEVVHHTELVARLLKEGRIRPRKEVRERVVYHDSCYLGRYNGVYDAPREILRAIPGVELVEMERNRENAMCCGAGGGLMWLEEREGTRVNVARTEQALATNPTVIGSACPYCLTMMSDGTKAKGVEDQVKTRDVVELLAEAL